MLTFDSIDILSTKYRTLFSIATPVTKNSIDILSTKYRTNEVLI